MVGVVTIPASYTAHAPRMIWYMGQAVDSEIFRADSIRELPGYWASSLLDLLFVFIHSHDLIV